MRRLICGTAAALLLGTVPAAAQWQRTAPVILGLPGSTRALGMGNVFAGGRGAEVLFYNPAQIGATRGTALAVQRYLTAATSGTFVTAGALGRIAVAAGFQYLDYHAEPGQFMRPGDLTTRGSLNATSLSASVAGAATWKGLRWGAAAKFAEEQLPGEREGRVLFDLGAGRDVAGLSLGLSVQNLGSDFSFDGRPARLPTRVNLGAYMPPKRIATYFDLAATAGISRERGGEMVPGAGAELIFEPVGGWRLAGRAGVRRVDGARPSESPITLGASFTIDRFSLDYSYVPYRTPDVTALALLAHASGAAAHRIGIRIQ